MGTANFYALLHDDGRVTDHTSGAATLGYPVGLLNRAKADETLTVIRMDAMPKEDADEYEAGAEVDGKRTVTAVRAR